jgi:hypothetical protein
MKNPSKSNVPARLDRGRERFERWRRQQKTHCRLPEPLWDLAVKLAREYGVNRTARTLRLEYRALKKRVEANASGDSSRESTGQPFLQLLGSELTTVMECVMECEDAHGTKLRLHIKGPQLPDLAAWIGKLWNRER